MSDLYIPKLLNHYRRPRNVRPLSLATHRGEQVNSSCGDACQVQLRVKAGRVEEISQQTDGCAVAVAAASIFSEQLVGKTPAEISGIDPENLEAILGFPVTPGRRYCASLSLEAMKKALKR